MQNILIVVDMQNDFIDGALGTREAEKIVSTVKNVIKNHTGRVIFTKDTHNEDYLNTLEGKNLPVKHCIKGTHGWEICNALLQYAETVVEKPTFGSTALAEMLAEENKREAINKITLVGLCTDICVISNALLIKATLPQAEMEVISNACAGVTPESHQNALNAMKMCQINII